MVRLLPAAIVTPPDVLITPLTSFTAADSPSTVAPVFEVIEMTPAMFRPSPVTPAVASTGGAAVDLAFAVGVFNNTADATVFGDASIDAGNTVTINSSLMYPFLTDPSELTSLQGIGNLVVSQGSSFVTTDLLDGTLGAGSLFLNDWVVARAKAQGSQAAAFALSIAVNVYTNNANSIVMSGAKINQNMNSIKDPGDAALDDHETKETPR